jgi:hypothetical protein
MKLVAGVMLIAGAIPQPLSIRAAGIDFSVHTCQISRISYSSTKY